MAGEPPLRIESLTLASTARPCDTTVARGEIVGLAGLEGHGQEFFLEVLAGLRRPAAGRVMVDRGDGRPVEIRGFRQAVRNGIAYLPRDRRANGIFPALSVLDNFSVVTFARDTRLGLIDFRRRRTRFAFYRERLSINVPRPDAPITTLSGGNQQKVWLARWLAREPRILLLNDPTRGVDQRTRETLYEVLRDLVTREHMTVIVLSTEIEEILRICDRTMVFRDQSMTRELNGDEMTGENILAAMFGR